MVIGFTARNLKGNFLFVYVAVMAYTIYSYFPGLRERIPELGQGSSTWQVIKNSTENLGSFVGLSVAALAVLIAVGQPLQWVDGKIKSGAKYWTGFAVMGTFCSCSAYIADQYKAAQNFMPPLWMLAVLALAIQLLVIASPKDTKLDMSVNP